MNEQKAFLRRIFPAMMAIAGLGFILLAAPACDGTGPRSGKEKAMTETISKTIPPLDAAAPAKTETASFALG